MLGHSRGRWPVPTLVLVVVSCGPGEPPVPPPPGEPELPASAAVPEAGPDSAEARLDRPPPRTVAPVASVPSGIFPHDAHQSVSCGTCHDPGPSHAAHATVECTVCHQVPEAYATLPVRSEEDCLACHHDPERAMPCARCHEAEGGGEVRVPASLQLSLATSSVERTLIFPHERHADSSCTTCHTSGVHFEVQRTCASCHRPHHRPEADCLSCHEPARERHEVEAHLGCSGSSCHERSYVEVLSVARSSCLTCHAEQQTHEPGPPCVQCHVIGGDLHAPLGPAGRPGDVP